MPGRDGEQRSPTGIAAQSDQPASTTSIADGIGADRHEAGLAEIEQAGEADIELQAEHEYAVDACQHADADPEIDAHERASSAEYAVRHEQQRQDENGEADRRLPARIEEQRRPFLRQADDDAPGQRAIGIADAAEHGGRKQAEQQREAEIRD